MTPLIEIEKDLEWREAEMAVFRILLSNNSILNREKLVLFRAGWALLYAHYEGYCKFALTVYYDAIKKAGKLGHELPPLTQTFAFSDPLKKLRGLSALDLLSAIRSFEADHLLAPATFPDVDTESNLWPTVLKKLVDSADIELDSVNQNSQKLRTLVARRNKIAHGERDIITEYDYFISFENAVMMVMIELAIKIDEKISTL